MIPPIVEIRQLGAAPVRIAVDAEVELGRECDGVILRDAKTSRRHLSLAPAGREVVVTDLGSSNGTFVNGVRLQAPARIGVGDVVALGDTELGLVDLSSRSDTERLTTQQVLDKLAERDTRPVDADPTRSPPPPGPPSTEPRS